MREIIEPIAREAGDLALAYFKSGLQVESKGHLDLVTAADRAVEQLLVDRIVAAFPNDGILGEEGAGRISRSGRTWVLDPIDGTFNFVRGSANWSVSIGLFDGTRPAFGALCLPAQGIVVLGGIDDAPTSNGVPLPKLPPLQRSYGAISLGFSPSTALARRTELLRFVVEDAGMAFRHIGCGSVSILDVVFGRVDGYIGCGESSWDIMAALAILEQIGGEDTIDWSISGLERKLNLVCGKPQFVALARHVVG